MKKLEGLLKQKIAAGRKISCIFLTLGYPSLRYTRSFIRMAARLGVDLVELGMPFSDPLADGPVIQASSGHSLAHGVRPDDALRLVRGLRAEGIRIPILFFSYYNPLFARGVARIAGELARAGFDGVLCPDLPPEEDPLLARELAKCGLARPVFVAPTTEHKRLRRLSRQSQGFVYYVSRRGVTGGDEKVDSELRRRVCEIKRATSLPVLVGFGISSPAGIRAVLGVADGVIVGSALIQAIEKHRHHPEQAIERYLKDLVAACDLSMGS